MIACFEARAYVKWLRNFISGLKVIDSIARPLKIYFDNSAAVFLTKNTKNSGGAKSVDLKFFKVREWIDNGDVLYKHIATSNMLADPLTKGLRPVEFDKHVEHTGVLSSFNVLGFGSSLVLYV